MPFLKAALFTLVFICNPAYAELSASHNSGFYAESFELKLNHHNANTIYYSLDGSVPTKELSTCFSYIDKYTDDNNYSESCFNTSSRQYDQPILIADQSAKQIDSYALIPTTAPSSAAYPKLPVANNWQNAVVRAVNNVLDFISDAIGVLFNFFDFINYLITDEVSGNAEATFRIPHVNYFTTTLPKAVVVRAKAEHSNESISRVFFMQGALTSTLPIIHITAPPGALYSSESGILVNGKDKEEPNWKIRRDINADVTLFSQEGELLYESAAKLRVHGGASRGFRIKSMRLYPPKNGVGIPVFNSAAPAKPQRINLRNSGQDYEYTYLADASIHKAMEGLHFLGQRYQPHVVFVNGQYHGILNARDRRDHYLIKYRFNLPNKHIDHIKRNGRVKRGDSKHWEHVLKTVETSDRTAQDFYPALAKLIDIESFIDYFSAQIYIANSDWPSNNIAYWRYKGTESHPITKSGYTDGRWRWLLYDTDYYGYGLHGRDDAAEKNSLERLMGFGPKSVTEQSLFRYLMENETVKMQFITRFSDLINTYFTAERFPAIIRHNEALIESEMPRHIQRWLKPDNMEDWRRSVDIFEEFFKQRPTHQKKHLQEQFGLGSPYNITVSTNKNDVGRVKFNTLTLHTTATNNAEGSKLHLQLPWQAEYFEGVPIQLSALPKKGYRFSRWIIDGAEVEDASANDISLAPSKDVSVKAIFKKIK